MDEIVEVGDVFCFCCVVFYCEGVGVFEVECVE